MPTISYGEGPKGYVANAGGGDSGTGPSLMHCYYKYGAGGGYATKGGDGLNATYPNSGGEIYGYGDLHRLYEVIHAKCS